jgi:hypothetical protein
MLPPPYLGALARLRATFAPYTACPAVLVSSLELEDKTRDAARAAFDAGVCFPALCAELGRVSVEALEHDRLAALAIGQAMVRWATPDETREAPGRAGGREPGRRSRRGRTLSRRVTASTARTAPSVGITASRPNPRRKMTPD